MIGSHAKIYTSIYDGSLVEDWRALITFQQMIVLCDAEGIIDMTPHAISRRTGIPIEHIEAGIRILENPDPYSRTPDENGKRIHRLDEHREWGWYIVNYQKYREKTDIDKIRAQTRERVRKHRQKNVTDETLRNATETQNNAKQKQKQKHRQRYEEFAGSDINQPNDISTNSSVIYVKNKEKISKNKPPYREIVDAFYEILPELPKVLRLTPKRQSAINARWTDGLPTIEHWREYFRRIRTSDFLMGRIEQRNGRDFKADFDFIINPNNVIKILEGKYENNRRSEPF